MWSNATDAPSLASNTVPSAYVQGSIDVNVVNINESPICPNMIETRSYTIVENSRPGTILSSNQGHYAAASADYVSDDSNGDISYKITDNIIGRMFVEAVDTSCELNNSALLRDGIFSNVWSKESCKRKCDWRKSCRSWEYNKTICKLFREIARCPAGSISCWLYMPSLSLCNAF